MTTQDTNTKTRILTDGVRIDRYADQVCLQDAAGNDIEETRGHVWRLDVRPDRDGQLERDEDFSLFVDILDTDQPVEKAAAQRIRAAAAELTALADKIDPNAPRTIIAQQPAEWAVIAQEEGQEPRTLVSGVSEKVAKSYADGFNRSGSRKQNAGNRTVRAEAVQIRIDQPEQHKPHTTEQLSRLLVEITGPNQPRYIVAFKDPRVGFCEQHNQRSNDGTTARIIEHPTLADVPNMDFNQVKGKASSPMSTSAGIDVGAGESDDTLQGAKGFARGQGRPLFNFQLNARFRTLWGETLPPTTKGQPNDNQR